MSARTLSSLHLFSATGGLVGGPEALAGAFAAVRIAERLGDPPRLTLSGIGGGALLDTYALVTRRAIVRAAFTGSSGTEITFWRAREAQASYGEAQAWSAQFDPLWLDLDGTVVSETVAASGFVDVGVTLAGTVAEVVARLLSPSSGAPTGLVTFTLGTVDAAVAAKRVLVTLTGASTLDGLRQALRASGAEMVFTAADDTSGALASYVVDVVERVGADAGARIMAGTGAAVNRLSATRKRDDAAYFSHLVATSSGDSPVTLASAAWPVTAATHFAGPNQTALSLSGSPVWEDDALEGLFVRARTGGPLFEVLASEAPSVLVVDGNASALDGTAIVFREGGDVDLVALPAAHAAHGRRLRRQSFDVSPFANALVEAGAAADFSAWSGGAPVGWAATGGAALALVASEGFVRYGTASVQVTAPQHGGLLSAPLDRLDARTVSAWVAAYVTSPGGRIRLELIDEDGTVHPIGEKVDSTSDTLQALSIGGAPLVGAAFRVRVVADSPTATFIVDAATVTRSSTAEAYSERMGPAALWQEAARLLYDEGAAVQPDAIEGRLLDLSAVVSGYDEIRIGDTVTASEEGPHGFTLTTRVVELEETFQTGDASTEKRIRLSQRRADLRRRLTDTTPPDPVPIVDPVRRAAPSAQYGLGYRYTGGGQAVVVLSWLGNDDVRSVRWTLTVGGVDTSGTANATSGSLELNAGAPIAPGTTVEVRASAYSEEDAVGEVEAAPYRLVTDVPIASASSVLTGRTVTLQGTTNQVAVSPTGARDLTSNPVWTLSLPQNIHAGATPTFARLTLSQATGTAPLAVTSQTLVTNLNTDLLDGFHAADFPRKAENATIAGVWTYSQQIAAQGGVRAWSLSMPASRGIRFNDDIAAPLFLQPTVGTTDALLGGYGLWMTWNAKWNGTKWTVERNDATGHSRLVRAGVGYHDVGFSVYSGIYDTVADAITWAQQFNVSTTGHVAAASLGLSGSATIGGSLSVSGNAGSPVFASGWSGSGWRVTVAGIGELASLTVRGTLSVYELLARRLDAVGGNLIVAPRIKVAAVTGSGPYTITDEFASALGVGAISDAEVGSFMIAQTATTSGVAQSVIRVTAKSGASVTAVLVSGAAPAAGRVYVAFDHLTDPAKRGRIYLTSRESGAPFISVSEGIGTGVWGSGSEKVRLGLLDGLTVGGRTMGDIFLGDPMATGVWGLVTQRALLTGSVVIGDVDGASITVTGSTLSFNNAGDALIQAVNGATLTLAAARINLDGVVTALNGGSFTRITGGAIETGSITGDKLSIAGTVYSGHTLAEHPEWAAGSGNIFVGATEDDETGPIVRVQGSGTASVVDMFYESAGAWGLRGVLGNETVFQLGSTNAIAAWAFATTRLSSTADGVTTALVSGETLATYGAFRGLLVESSGAARVLVGDVDLPSDLAYTPTSLTSTITDAGFEAASGSVTGSLGNETPSTTTAGWTLAAGRGGTASIQTGSVYAGSKALRLYAPKAYVADGYAFLAPYSATATTWAAVAVANRGRTMRLSLRVRSSMSIFDLGWLTGWVAIKARTAAPNSEWTVLQRVWVDQGLSNSWQQVVVDFVCPADAVDVGVELRVEGPRETDSGSPAWVDVYADALELSVFDRSVSILGPRGLWVYSSPLASLRLADTGVEMTTTQIQTLGLRLMDSGITPDPPAGQAVMFKRGRDLYVRFADGSEKQVQLI